MIIVLNIGMIGNVVPTADKSTKELAGISTSLNPSEWSPYDELTSPVLTINPEAARELLRVVQEECNHRLTGIFIDEKCDKKCRHVEELIKACEITEQNCDDYEREYGGNQKIKSSNLMYPNIVKLLDHYRDSQFELCKEKLRMRLKNYVGDLPKNLEYDFLLLKKHIFVMSRQDPLDKIYRIDNQDLLARGILGYLKYRNDNLFAKISKEGNLGEKILKAEFENSIEKPCRMIVRRLFSPIRVFKTLSLEENMYPKLEDFSLAWLENCYLCDSILEKNKDELFSSIYNLLMADAPKQKRRSSSSSWMERYASLSHKPKFL